MDNDDDTMSGRKKHKGSGMLPPTLDLPASEVVEEAPAFEPAVAEPRADEPLAVEPLAVEPLAVEPEPRVAAEPESPAAEAVPPEASSDAVPETPVEVSPELPVSEGPAPEAATVDAEAEKPPEAARAKIFDQPGPTSPRLDIFADAPAQKNSLGLPTVAAALIGGVAGAALMLGVAVLGFLPGKAPAGDPAEALAPRLTAIEQDLAAARKIADDATTRIDAAASSAKAASDTATSAVNLAAEAKGVATQTADKLAQATLSAPATTTPADGGAPAAVDLGPLTGRIAKAEAANDDLKSAIAPLGDKLAAASSGLAAADQRLTAVEKSLAAGPADKTAAYAVALSEVGNALRTGRPYEAELAAATAIGGDAAALAPLAASAGKGVPSAETLSRDFEALAPKLVAALEPKPEGPPPDAGVLDRFWYSVVNSGTVTHDGDPLPGAAAVPIKLIGDMLRRGDVAAAVDAFQALPDAAKTVGADWLGQASATVEAMALIRAQTTATLQKLSKQ